MPVKNKDKLEFCNIRFKKIKDNYILTNDTGDWIFLNRANFDLLRRGKIKKGGKLFQKLEREGFTRGEKGKFYEKSGKYHDLFKSVFFGPTLFIIVLTLRCNHRCLYCHAVPSKKETSGVDMTEGMAKKIVDMIFRAPSRAARIEFQGGEPLLNWPVLEYIVKYSKAVNKEKKKDLQISLVSNLTVLDEKKLKFLLDEGVSLCCSFDGPAVVHDKNRIFLDGESSYGTVSAKMKKIHAVFKKRKARDKNFSQKLDAVLTVSRFSLGHPKEIVDEYIKQGFTHIYIRPLNHFGLKIVNADKIGYDPEEYINFYKKALDYILEVNMKGTLFIERNAFFMLKKILEKTDPANLDMRSPCGAGIGQIAFNYDGKIYTCDDARMAARMGYDNFRIGAVGEDNYNDLINNEVVKTTCLASCLNNHAGCSDCAYNPYCGICPVANFVEFGTVFPQIPNTDRCKINKAVFDYLFSKIRQKKYRDIFEKWMKKPPNEDKK